MWISVVLVDYIMKEIYPVDAQLDCSVYDGSYIFRLGTVKLCMDGLYRVIEKDGRDLKPL